MAIYIFFDAKKRVNVLISLAISILSYIPIVAVLYLTLRKKIPLKLTNTILCSKCGNNCNEADIRCNKCNNTLRV